MTIDLRYGDTIEQMKLIPDKSIDFICCDLPYGMTAPKWDEHIDMVELWKQYNRIIKKNGTIALFASQPFTTKIISSNEKDFRYCWYWLKNQGNQITIETISDAVCPAGEIQTINSHFLCS